MKKIVFITCVALITFQSYAQIEFENGYFIDNQDQKIDCLIKNLDWKNNPTYVEFKLSESDVTEKFEVADVKEFGINNVSKFERHKVKMDRSSENLNKLSKERNPKFYEEDLLLRVLVDGQATLFMYEEGNLRRYFYALGDASVEQLIYKKYITLDNKIAENSLFKQQLWNNLKCTNFSRNKFQNIKYSKSDMTNLFAKYNECVNEEYINYEKKQDRDLFNLSIRPGLNNSSLVIHNSLSNFSEAKFNEWGFRFGIEAEFIFPFRKNKWAFLIEPTYQYFKSQKAVSGKNVKIDYKSIELPLGIRHYFFINEKSRIFINGALVVDINFGSSLVDLDLYYDLEMQSRNGFAFGLGIAQNNKYNVELRYHLNREVLHNYLYWGSDYNTLSLIFGYTIF